MNKKFFSIGAMALFSALLLFLPIFCSEVQGEEPEIEASARPYDQVRLIRLSFIEGDVLLQRGDSEEWIPAAVNMPLRPHDKIWAPVGTRAEIQFDDGTTARLAENSNLDIVGFREGVTHIELTLGVASFSTRTSSRTSRMETLEIFTPQSSIRVNGASKLRVEVAEDESSRITVREGKIEIETNEEPVFVGKGEEILIEGSNNPQYIVSRAGMPDEWDRWSEERDGQIIQSESYRHLPPGVTSGGAELDEYGSWIESPEYGWVWAPRVDVGWAPYNSGRWVWIDPWGWTWVSYEPWGWAPYHYGRWATVSTGWVWVPGRGRAVWSPGYVRFIYGPDWVAWVPLGPGEVYYYDSGIHIQVEVNLINYSVPGAVMIVPRRTFVTGLPYRKGFIPPRDPLRSGRVIAGPPPIVPARESLNPYPGRVIRDNLMPPAIIHRPVTYHAPVSSPPVPFDRRIKDIHQTVIQGRSPLTLKPEARERDIRAFKDTAGERDGIRKDITIHKTFPSAVREPSREVSPPARELRPQQAPPEKAVRPPQAQSSVPDRQKRGVQPSIPKQFDVKKEAPGRPSQAKPLYQKRPGPEKQREFR